MKPLPFTLRNVRVWMRNYKVTLLLGDSFLLCLIPNPLQRYSSSGSQMFLQMGLMKINCNQKSRFSSFSLSNFLAAALVKSCVCQGDRSSVHCWGHYRIQFFGKQLQFDNIYQDSRKHLYSLTQKLCLWKSILENTTK